MKTVLNFCLLGDYNVKYDYSVEGSYLNEDGDFREHKFTEIRTLPCHRFLDEITQLLKRDDLVEFSIEGNSFNFSEFNPNTGEECDYHYEVLQIGEDL